MLIIIAKPITPLSVHSPKNKVRIIAKDTNLSFSLKGHTGSVVDGRANIPDGEVCTGPIKNSVNGTIRYNVKSKSPVGSPISNFTTLFLKSEIVSSNGFVNLVIPLHAAMVGLLIFIVKILSKFMTLISTMFATQMAGIGSATDVLGKLSSISGLNMGIFGGIPSQLLNIYLLAVVLILTFTNTLASKVVKGGANYLLYYYGSILSITSGVLMILLPKIINWAFSIPTLIGGG